MKLALLASGCVLASLIAACTIAKQSISPHAIGVIELIVIDAQGWPLPVWVVASKPGYATSQPTLLLPGYREITLHALARVN
jgi:hypothetical protein